MGARQLTIGFVTMLLVVLGSCGGEDNPQMPDVVGDSSDVAERKLSDADILVKFEEEPTSEADCRVTEQTPPPGADAGPTVEARLRCEVEVPEVVGEKAQQAEATLDELAFKPMLVNKPPKFDLRTCRVREHRGGIGAPCIGDSVDAEVQAAPASAESLTPEPPSVIGDGRAGA